MRKDFGRTGTLKMTSPVREAVSYRQDYEDTYLCGFPMIAAYKVMGEFTIVKTNPQYKAPFNQI